MYTGNSRELLCTNCDVLTAAITPNLYTVTNGLYSKGLILWATLQQVFIMGVIPDHVKAMQLMPAIQQQLESTSDSDQYLINICQVLINQQHQPPIPPYWTS